MGEDVFVFAGGEDFLVLGVVVLDAGGEFAIGAVVDEGADGNSGDELGIPPM